MPTIALLARYTDFFASSFDSSLIDISVSDFEDGDRPDTSRGGGAFFTSCVIEVGTVTSTVAGGEGGGEVGAERHHAHEVCGDATILPTCTARDGCS